MNFNGSGGHPGGLLSSSEQLTLAHVSQLQYAFSRERNENIRNKFVCEQLEQKLQTRELELQLEQRRVELLTTFALGDGEPNNILFTVLSWLLSDVCPPRSVSLKCCIKSGETWNIIEAAADSSYRVFQDTEFDAFAESIINRDPVTFPRSFLAATSSLLLRTEEGVQAHMDGVQLISVCSRCVWLVFDNDKSLNPYSQSLCGLTALSYLVESVTLLETASQLMMSSVIRYLESVELVSETVKSTLFEKLQSMLTASSSSTINSIRAQWIALPGLAATAWNSSAVCTCEVYMVSKQPSTDRRVLLSSEYKVQTVEHPRVSLLTSAIEQDRVLVSSLNSSLAVHDAVDCNGDNGICTVIAVGLPKPADLSSELESNGANGEVLAGNQEFGIVFRFRQSVTKRDIRMANAVADSISSCLYTWLVRTNFQAFNFIRDDGSSNSSCSSEFTDSEFVDSFRRFLYSGMDGLLADNQRVLSAMSTKLCADWVLSVRANSSSYDHSKGRRGDGDIDDDSSSSDLEDERVVTKKPILKAAGSSLLVSLTTNNGHVHGGLTLDIFSGSIRDYIIRALFSSTEFNSAAMQCSHLSDVDVRTCGLKRFIAVPSTYQGVFDEIPNALHHCVGVTFTASACGVDNNNDYDESGSSFIFIVGRSWRPFSLPSLNSSLAHFSSILSLFEECRSMRKLFAVTDNLKSQISNFENDHQLEMELFELQDKLHNIQLAVVIPDNEDSTVANFKDAQEVPKGTSRVLENKEAVKLRVKFVENVAAYVKQSFIPAKDNQHASVCKIICAENLHSNSSKVNAIKVWELTGAGDWEKFKAPTRDAMSTDTRMLIANSPIESVSPAGVSKTDKKFVAVSQKSSRLSAQSPKLEISPTKTSKSPLQSSSSAKSVRNRDTRIDLSKQRSQSGTTGSAQLSNRNGKSLEEYLINQEANDNDIVRFVDSNLVLISLYSEVCDRFGSRSHIRLYVLIRTYGHSAADLVVPPREALVQSFQLSVRSFVCRWNREFFASSTLIESLETKPSSESEIVMSPGLRVGTHFYEASLLVGRNGLDYWFSQEFVEQLGLVVPHFFIAPIKIRDEKLFRASVGNVGNQFSYGDGFDVLDALYNGKVLPAKLSQSILRATAELLTSETSDVVSEPRGQFTCLSGLGETVYHYYSDYMDIAHSSSQDCSNFGLLFTQETRHPTVGCIQFLILPRSSKLIVPSQYDRLQQCLNDALVPLVLAVKSSPLYAAAEATVTALVNSAGASKKESTAVLKGAASAIQKQAMQTDRSNTLLPALFHAPLTRKNEVSPISGISMEVMKTWLAKGTEFFGVLPNTTIRSAGFVLTNDGFLDDVDESDDIIRTEQSKWSLKRCCGDSGVPELCESERGGSDVRIPGSLSSVSHNCEIIRAAIIDHSGLQGFAEDTGSSAKDSAFWVECKEYDIDMRSTCMINSARGGHPSTGDANILNGTSYPYVHIVAVFVVSRGGLVNSDVTGDAKPSSQNQAIAAAVFCVCSTTLQHYAPTNLVNDRPGSDQFSRTSARPLSPTRGRMIDQSSIHGLSLNMISVNSYGDDNGSSRFASGGAGGAKTRPKSPSGAGRMTPTSAPRHFFSYGLEDESEDRFSRSSSANVNMQRKKSAPVDVTAPSATTLSLLRAKSAVLNISKAIGGYLYSMFSAATVASAVTNSLRVELAEECAARVVKQNCINRIMKELQDSSRRVGRLTSGSQTMSPRGTPVESDSLQPFADIDVINAISNLTARWHTAETSVSKYPHLL
jgi:hypothetical protein